MVYYGHLLTSCINLRFLNKSEQLASRFFDELTGNPYYTSEDLVQATQDTSAYVASSGNLRLLATRLSKIASDIRLQSSGPRAGLGQYRIPQMQLHHARQGQPSDSRSG